MNRDLSETYRAYFEIMAEIEETLPHPENGPRNQPPESHTNSGAPPSGNLDDYKRRVREQIESGQSVENTKLDSDLLD